MVNPGAFRGSRKEFMMGEKPAYKAGVEGGYAADALANIQRRYFKRYPVDLAHEEEPTSEFLAAVDDLAADLELPPPDVGLNPEEFESEVEKRRERGKRVDYRKAQIKRWLAYQHMKDQDIDPKDSGAENPYRILLHKLTGVTLKKPRAKPPANIWRRGQRIVIETEVRRQLQLSATNAGELPSGAEHKKLASIREKVAKRLFDALSVEDRNHWAEVGKEEHEAALSKWSEDTKAAASQEPADRQRCIQGLVRFAQPILELISEATGWKATLIAGGPEPAHQGLLNVISVHSGTTSGDVKLNFGRSERVKYKKLVVPTYGEFLKKCYTPEECRARALPEDLGFESLQQLGLEEVGADFDNLQVTLASAVLPIPSQFINPATNAQGHCSSGQPRPSINDTMTAEGPLSPPRSLQTSTVEDRLPPTPPASSNLAISPTTTLVEPSALPDGLPMPTIQHLPQPARAIEPCLPPTPPITPLEATNSATSLMVPPVDHSSPSMRPVSLPIDPSAILANLQAMMEEDAVRYPSRSPSTDPWGIQLPHPLSRAASMAPSPMPSPAASPSRHSLEPNVRNPHDIEMADATQSKKRKAPSKPKKAPPKTGKRTAGKKTRKTTKKTGKATKKATSKATKRAAPAEGVLTDEGEENARPAKRARRHEAAHGGKDEAAAVPNTATIPSTTRKLAAPSSSSISHPSDAPDWLKNAVSLLTAVDLGPEWSKLVRAWLAFETREDWDGVSRLKAKHRPAAIAEWVKRARSPTWRPAIADIGSYGREHMEWWAYLQPAWRTFEDGSVNAQATVGDWETLRRPGINGLVSVLASLFYWGSSAQTQSTSLSKWSDSISDCLLCVNSLA